MTLIISISTIVATIVYCTYLLLWRRVWQSQKTTLTQYTVGEQLSVVVAMHNEEQHATTLLNNLLAQTHKPKQIIVVLDHCTDRTNYEVQQVAQHSDKLITILTNNNKQGKKHAQRLGVEYATTQYVAVTDADCHIPANWLGALSQSIATTQADLLIAPVTMNRQGNALFQRLAEMEFLALQAVSAGTALSQQATMCNGANLAFRRSVYLQHNAHNQYISGDDMFLLAEVKRHGGKVAYALSTDALVQTACPPTALSYYKQRTRWLRKASGYTDVDVKRLSMIVFCGNAAWPIALVANPIIALICLFLKTFAEALLLNATHKHWQLKINVIDIAILALVYPFNLLTISILSLFRSRKKW